MKVIAADVGGTKSWLVLADLVSPGNSVVRHEARYPSADFKDFTALLKHFLQQSGQESTAIDCICLGFPGPVSGNRVTLTNLDWTIHDAEIKKAFAIDQVIFINDFQAAALGTLDLNQEDYTALNPQQAKAAARRAVVGAGTGLGTAYMHWQNDRYHAYSTEAGHMSFAPQDEEQTRLHSFLAGQYGHVSYERILSGQGLVDLYRFFADAEPNGDELIPRWVNEQAGGENNSAARSSLELFVKIYGAYAGNIALTFKPEGGLYLVGGVTKKIGHWLESADFLAAYLNKGRMRKLASGIPVYLVNNERIGLQGAIRYAEYKMG